MLPDDGHLSQGQLSSGGTVPLDALEVDNSFKFGVSSISKMVAPIPSRSLMLPFRLFVIHLQN